MSTKVRGYKGSPNHPIKTKKDGWLLLRSSPQGMQLALVSLTAALVLIECLVSDQTSWIFYTHPDTYIDKIKITERPRVYRVRPLMAHLVVRETMPGSNSFITAFLLIYSYKNETKSNPLSWLLVEVEAKLILKLILLTFLRHLLLILTIMICFTVYFAWKLFDRLLIHWNGDLQAFLHAVLDSSHLHCGKSKVHVFNMCGLLWKPVWYHCGKQPKKRQKIVFWPRLSNEILCYLMFRDPITIFQENGMKFYAKIMLVKETV